MPSAAVTREQALDIPGGTRTGPLTIIQRPCRKHVNLNTFKRDGNNARTLAKATSPHFHELSTTVLAYYQDGQKAHGGCHPTTHKLTRAYPDGHSRFRM